MYDIEYTESAQQDLKYFRKHDQALIYDEIDSQLRYEPMVETRNVNERVQTKQRNGNCELTSFGFFITLTI